MILCLHFIVSVEDVFDIQTTDVPWGKRERISKFLFIGKKLNKEKINEILLGATN